MRYPSEHDSLSTQNGASKYLDPNLDLHFEDTSSLSRDDMRQYMQREDIREWIDRVAEQDGAHTLDRIENAGPPPAIVQEIWARAYPLLVRYSVDGYTTWEMLLYVLQTFDPERGHLSTAITSGPGRCLRAGSKYLYAISSCLVRLANRGNTNPTVQELTEEYDDRYANPAPRDMLRQVALGNYNLLSLDGSSSAANPDKTIEDLYDVVDAEDTDPETLEDLAYYYAEETGHIYEWAIILDEIRNYRSDSVHN